MVSQAVEIANELKKVIDKQRLYNDIQGRRYVKVEGWQTLGTLMNIQPREVPSLTRCLEDGSYEATVELVNIISGRVVGMGSAICGIEEKRWANADRYARRSMAITRATGKAFRLGFAWIMALAGYETTPDEEMPREPHYEFDNDAKKAVAEMMDDMGIPKEEWPDYGAKCRSVHPRDWYKVLKAEMSVRRKDTKS